MSGSIKKIPNLNRTSAQTGRVETESRPESTRSNLARVGDDGFRRAFPLLSTIVEILTPKNKDGAYERAQQNINRERSVHHSAAMLASLTNITIEQGQSVILLKELLSVVKNLKSASNQNNSGGSNLVTSAAAAAAAAAAGAAVNNILSSNEQPAVTDSEDVSSQPNNTVTPRIRGDTTPRISASTTPEPAASRVNQEAIERFTPQAEREVDRALQKYNFTSEQYQNYDQFRENLVRSTARDIPRTRNEFRSIREAQIDDAVLREVTRHARQTGNFADMMIANQPVYRNRPLSESQVSTMTTAIGMGQQYPEWLTRQHNEQREQARQSSTAPRTSSTSTNTYRQPVQNSTTPAGQSAATPTEQAATPAGQSASGLVRPTSGDVSSPFGMRSMGNHEGMDFAAPVGTPIVAAHSGTVVEVRESPSYGNMIRIHGDNGVDTLYAHLSSFGVQQDQQVTAGQQIALSGNTGRSTGPHLHFEAIRNGTKIDPAPLLGLSGSQSTQSAGSQTSEPTPSSSDASPVASTPVAASIASSAEQSASPAQMMAAPATNGAAIAGASQANAVAERTPVAPTVVSPDSAPNGEATPGSAAPGTFSSPNDPGNVEPVDSADRYAKLFNMAA